MKSHSMSDRPEDICPEPVKALDPAPDPLSPPLYFSSVYRCSNPSQATALLTGAESGYVYCRDGHPNADMLAEKCRRLHGAERAAIAATGMGALALLVLAQLEAGDHIVVSNQLYGVSLELLTSEVGRLGIRSTVVDTTNLEAVGGAMGSLTKLLVVETISNPLLRVADIAGLAELAHQRGAQLLVDNSFASPAVCRPLELGADWVMESLTKIMGGHSDVVLGCICGYERNFDRIAKVLSRWGLASSPMDCWLALRGLSTLAIRVRQASGNALAVAEWLNSQPQISAVFYPGLATHPDHDLALQLFKTHFGSMVTFTLSGGRLAGEAMIAAVSSCIPFCPSLGEVSTTLSHPQSTSHRGLSEEERNALGIEGGTIRLSVGIESADAIIEGLAKGLAAC